MNKERRAPQGGYDFEEKNKYRHSVWKCFAENVKDVSTAIVAFLPSKEGLEIPIALEYGFKEDNLVAIDDNPAMIAVSEWRKNYPLVKFYGNDVGRAAERMAKDGIFVNAANLDLCGNVSNKMFDVVESFIRHQNRMNPVVSITMMEGREQHAVNCLAEIIIKETKDTKAPKRLNVLLQEIYRRTKNHIMSTPFCSEYNDHATQCITVKETGRYKSSRVYMVWGCFRFFSPKGIKDFYLPYVEHFGGVSNSIRGHFEDIDTLVYSVHDKNESSVFFKNAKKEFNRISSICRKEIKEFNQILDMVNHETDKESIILVGQFPSFCVQDYNGSSLWQDSWRFVDNWKNDTTSVFLTE